MWRVLAVTLSMALGALLAAHLVFAQGPPTGHMAHMGDMRQGEPALPGQDAFGAIAEIVQLLEADPQTDWNKVDLERLRQHLIDMNEVVLRSQVKQSPVPGGLVMEVTGAGRTEQGIRAMVVPHAVELDRMPDWSDKAEVIPGGVRLTVTAKKNGGKFTIRREASTTTTVERGFSPIIDFIASNQISETGPAF